MIPAAALAPAKILYAYNQLNQQVGKADCLFVFGSNDLRVADYAAEIALTHNFTRIVISGGIAHVGEIVDAGWNIPEAEVFANRMVALGVPSEYILREPRAQNSGDNVNFSRELLAANNVTITSGLIIHKPFMERRAFATATAQWPQIEWSVTSPRQSFEDFASGQSTDVFLHTLTGDTARMEPYAALGYQTPQPMPENVRQALQSLIALGYTQYLPKFL